MGQDVRKWYSVNVIGQTDNEDSYRSQPKSIPTTTESVPVGISPTTIEIDRDTFMKLINNRIRMTLKPLSILLKTLLCMFIQEQGTEYDRKKSTRLHCRRERKNLTSHFPATASNKSPTLSEHRKKNFNHNDSNIILLSNDLSYQEINMILVFVSQANEIIKRHFVVPLI